MFVPYKIDTLFKHWPIANWLIMAAMVLTFVGSLDWSNETIAGLILGGTSATGLITHLFLHDGLLHLAGNMLFLWVFGNAVCGMTSNLVYPLLFAVFGILAAAAHLAFDGSPALGASGAIDGIVGMAFAMYPLNNVHVFWFIVVRGGTWEMPLWTLALVWLAFDAYGAFFGHDDVAYWAHLGGFLAGVLAGFIALKLRWVTLTEYDNAPLTDVLAGKHRRVNETAEESYRRRRYEALKD
jgi:membrane associated rhomboid family serine protease